MNNLRFKISNNFKNILSDPTKSINGFKIAYNSGLTDGESESDIYDIDNLTSSELDINYNNVTNRLSEYNSEVRTYMIEDENSFIYRLQFNNRFYNQNIKSLVIGYSPAANPKEFKPAYYSENVESFVSSNTISTVILYFRIPKELVNCRIITNSSPDENNHYDETYINETTSIGDDLGDSIQSKYVVDKYIETLSHSLGVLKNGSYFDESNNLVYLRTLNTLPVDYLNLVSSITLNVVNLLKSIYPVVDNLNSQNSHEALSANQGYVLNKNKLDKGNIQGWASLPPAIAISNPTSLLNYHNKLMTLLGPQLNTKTVTIPIGPWDMTTEDSKIYSWEEIEDLVNDSSIDFINAEDRGFIRGIDYVLIRDNAILRKDLLGGNERNIIPLVGFEIRSSGISIHKNSEVGAWSEYQEVTNSDNTPRNRGYITLTYGIDVESYLGDPPIIYGDIEQVLELPGTSGMMTYSVPYEILSGVYQEGSLSVTVNNGGTISNIVRTPTHINFRLSVTSLGTYTIDISLRSSFNGRLLNSVQQGTIVGKFNAITVPVPTNTSYTFDNLEYDSSKNTSMILDKFLKDFFVATPLSVYKWKPTSIPSRGQVYLVNSNTILTGSYVSSLAVQTEGLDYSSLNRVRYYPQNLDNSGNWSGDFSTNMKFKVVEMEGYGYNPKNWSDDITIHFNWVDIYRFLDIKINGSDGPLIIEIPNGATGTDTFNILATHDTNEVPDSVTYDKSNKYIEPIPFSSLLMESNGKDAKLNIVKDSIPHSEMDVEVQRYTITGYSIKDGVAIKYLDNIVKDSVEVILISKGTGIPNLYNDIVFNLIDQSRVGTIGYEGGFWTCDIENGGGYEQIDQWLDSVRFEFPDQVFANNIKSVVVKFEEAVIEPGYNSNPTFKYSLDYYSGNFDEVSWIDMSSEETEIEIPIRTIGGVKVIEFGYMLTSDRSKVSRNLKISRVIMNNNLIYTSEVFGVIENRQRGCPIDVSQNPSTPPTT